MFEKSRTSFLPAFILIIPATIVLWWHGYLGYYSRPLADDFCSFYAANRLGLIRSIWFWRLTWSGRYSAYAVDWILLKTLSIKGIAFVVPSLLIIWLCLSSYAIFLMLRSNGPKSINSYLSISSAVLFLFALLTLSPNIPQSLYWFNGMRSYSLPLIMVPLLYILFQLKERIVGSKMGVAAAIILTLSLAFLNAGLSETFAIFQLVLLGFLILYKIIITRKLKVDVDFTLLVSGVVGNIIGLLVIITAPGNAIRQTGLPPPPTLAVLLSISLRAYSGFLQNIITSPEKITALSGCLLAMFWLGRQYKITINNPGKHIILCVLGAFLISFSCFPPGVYAYSDNPPSRIIIIPAFIFLLLLMIAGFILGNLMALLKFETLLVLSSFALICFSAWYSTSSLLKEKPVYVSFAQKWDSVDQLIKQAKLNAQPNVIIPAMPNWAILDYPNDNQEFWATECYTHYYGIRVYGPSR